MTKGNICCCWSDDLHLQKTTTLHRKVDLSKDLTRMSKLIILLLFFVQLYLCDADVSADIFCQIDHVSLLSQHHDESSQRLRVEGGHRIFFCLLFRLLFLILICLSKRPGDYYHSRQNSLKLLPISVYVFICLYVWTELFSNCCPTLPPHHFLLVLLLK